MINTSIRDITILNFDQYCCDGILTVLQGDDLSSIPFPIRRIFTISNVPAGGQRGNHAHLHCTQVVLCLKGSVTVEIDDGQQEIVMVLENASQGIMILPGLWNKLTFKDSDTVLAVICDQPYSPEDYLRNRTVFMTLKGL
jgi:dTDP-4-dehydrorhamnose 3,5-epimerase-like enzyme